MHAVRLNQPKPVPGEDGLYSGVVPKRYDPTEFQYQDKANNVFQLSELSREDLLQVACYGMAAMEQMDILIDKQRHLSDCWRRDDDLPSEPVE